MEPVDEVVDNRGMTLLAVPDYKGPARRSTRRRVQAHAQAGLHSRLRKWAERRAAAPEDEAVVNRQVALDVLALLRELDHPA